MNLDPAVERGAEAQPLGPQRVTAGSRLNSVIQACPVPGVRTGIVVLLLILVLVESGAGEPDVSMAPPPWVPGYGVRYVCRVLGDPAGQPAETVTVRIPTGGWLKDDASDLVVQTSAGKSIPLIVLSHDARGDTMLQFRRNGDDRWYWVYAANSAAPPRDVAMQKKLATGKKAAEQSVLAKMAAQKMTAKCAGELRDITARISREKETAAKAVAELAALNQLLPEQIVADKAAEALIPLAREEAERAAAANAPFAKVVQEKSAIAKGLARAAAAACRAAQQAARAHEKVARESKLALAASEAAVAAVKAADEATHKAADEATHKAAGAAEEGTDKAVDEARRKAAEMAQRATQAQRVAGEKAAAVRVAEAKRSGLHRISVDKEAASAIAGKEARAARLAAAPTGAARTRAKRKLSGLTAAAKSASASVAATRKRIVEATAVRTAAENVLAQLTPQLAPIQKAASVASAAVDRAVALAQSTGDAYYKLAHAIDPRLFKEGLTVEFREWAGDKLNSWPDVVAGLQRSDNVLGNAVVGQVAQLANVFRRSDPRNFAVSYRGYLAITKPGIYSFFVNGDDATFLFINGYKVYSRTGTNQPRLGRVPLYAVGADIQLEAGVHPFEVHQIVGNTPGARGRGWLLWLIPGSKTWELVPQSAFTQGLMAVPVDIEACDGGQVAVFEPGMDDALCADGASIYLVRCEVQGSVVDPAKLIWDFGDGTTGVGRSLFHVFFETGDVEISLQSHPNLRPFRRRYHVWLPPVQTGPHSLATAVHVLSSMDITRLKLTALNDIFQFLLICEQPTRWPVMARLCRHLIKNKNLDIQYRALLYASLMESLAQQGHAADALDLVDQALDDAGRTRASRALIVLQAANINRDFLRDFKQADKLYGQIIGASRRLKHPLIRQAAVGWGDMFMDAGDLARAGDAFRLARSLAAVGHAARQDDPVRRGALLRVAEQQLSKGDIRQTRRMLHRIESEFPDQKLEGIYRFLRGEAERHGGRYEDAIRNYEVLIQLRQWASYRPHALFGIADSYYRMGDYGNALEWLARVKGSFPAFFTARSLEQYHENILARQERMAAIPHGEPEGGVAPGMFAAIEDSFEAGEGQPLSELAGRQSRQSMGFSGPGTFLARRLGGAVCRLPVQQLHNVPSQGALWVAYWYRERLGIVGQGKHRAFTVSLLTETDKIVTSRTIYPERTFGRWHKAGFRLPLPATTDGSVAVDISDAGELLELDALRVMHVSDSQETALRNFIEGGDPQ